MMVTVMSKSSDGKKLKTELMSNILTLIVRIVGESVKDKLARALIIGAVGVFGYYYDVPVDTSKVDPTPPAVVVNQ